MDCSDLGWEGLWTARDWVVRELGLHGLEIGSWRDLGWEGLETERTWESRTWDCMELGWNGLETAWT